MSTLDELLDYIFDGTQTEFYPEFAAWVRGSRRFKAFVIRYRSKIRAKLKTVRDEHSLKEVRAELETALLLLHEDRFALDYEKYAAKQRGPDLTVTFKTHTPFNVEVRRIRSMELDDEDSEAHIGKLMAVLCEKIRQMPPSIINFVWLWADQEIPETDLTQALLKLRQLADRKVEDYFTRRGFASAADFLKHYHHLSGIIWGVEGQLMIWLNTAARHKASPDIVNAIKKLQAE